jgi:hypothetical protein
LIKQSHVPDLQEGQNLSNGLVPVKY